jgi:hypothetical protein
LYFAGGVQWKVVRISTHASSNSSVHYLEGTTVAFAGSVHFLGTISDAFVEHGSVLFAVPLSLLLWCEFGCFSWVIKCLVLAGLVYVQVQIKL